MTMPHALLVPGLGYPSDFTGLLDLVPNAAAAYSVARKLRAAYAGSAIRLRRDSDNAESDFGFTSAGDLDTAAIVTWLGAASGYLTTLYDQSGNGRDALQSTATNQPLYVASIQNSKPGVRFDGNDNRLVTASISPELAQPLTYYAPLNSTLAAGRIAFDSLTEDANTRISLGTGDGSTQWSIQAGTGINVGTATGMNLWSFVFSGASSVQRRNGGGVSTSNSGTKNTDGWVLGARYTLSSHMGGDMLDFIVFGAAHTSAEWSVVEANINAYYAIY